DYLSAREGSCDGFLILISLHRGVLRLADEFFHLITIGAQRTRLENLPLVLARAAEFEARLAGGIQLNAAEFVLIEDQEMLLAQVFRLLVESRLDRAADGEEAIVAVELDVGSARGGIVLAEAHYFGAAVGQREGHGDLRGLQAIGREVG